MIDVRKATFGLSPSMGPGGKAGCGGQPGTPMTGQAPLISTKPSLAEPASPGQGPLADMCPAAPDTKSRVPVLIPRRPRTKNAPHKKASGAPAQEAPTN